MSSNSGPSLVYDFRRKYDRIVSGANSDIRVVDIIAYLNEAQYLWFESRSHLFEINTRARNELRKFEIKRKKLTPKTLDKNISYIDYPSDFYRDLAVSVTACCKGCDIPKEIFVTKTQTDDLSFSRTDPHRMASFEYEQLLGDEAGDRYYIYHEGVMDIKEVYLNYLRKPKEIHAASLVKCSDGSYGYEYDGKRIGKDSGFEGDSTYASRTIVDIAVLNASRDKGNIQDYQSMLNKLLTLEKQL